MRTARRRLLKIDPAWPWADVITTAHARLMALPAPDHQPTTPPTKDPEHRQTTLSRRCHLPIDRQRPQQDH